ncbi:MAG: NAD(P)H-dependent oxidoreductase subunit E [Marinobacter sp.]
MTLRVCGSLSCCMAGAEALHQALADGTDPAQVRVMRAPCMGRCDTAPVVAVGHIMCCMPIPGMLRRQ